MTPLVLEDDGRDNILGVNVVDINPAHQLLAFGIDGSGSVRLWDPRSRSEVGVLRLPTNRLVPPNATASPLSITALSSRMDGLSYAVGTSTGHTLLYDIRSPRPTATKDQGYGLPVKNVCWIEGGSRMAGDGMVMSSDKKVIKIWEKDNPSSNFASITPATDLNHVHHIPGSGLIMTTNEGIQMGTYYIPQLGPAPRWASFLENITEEMEDQTTRSVYEDFKFVERSELKTLGLDHLVGTPALKPYMHGYFVALKLYDTARLIANPFSYAEHREKLVKEKMEKMAETRIRAKKQTVGDKVKVNKALAEKLLREEEKARKREEKMKAAKAKKLAEAAEGHDGMDVDEEEEEETIAAKEDGGEKRPNLLSDPRFAQLFEDPEFQVDEESREYALLNPSSVAQKRQGGWAKTVVEEEEDESDKPSSDGLESASDSETSEDESGDSDSSDANELAHSSSSRVQKASRTRPAPRTANVKLVPMQARTAHSHSMNKNASFGQRRSATSQPSRSRATEVEGGMEMSWVPSSSKVDDDDTLMPDNTRKVKSRRKGAGSFGAGLEKGGEFMDEKPLSESERKGRTQRRQGVG
ncbi:hypothetical protein ONZ45_g918 [Pleurotus djamor]|nr:hypothetical protein ONZ45_g918 [Pleurotus djamor]